METLDTRQTNRLNLIFQSLYALLLALFVLGSRYINKASFQYVVIFFVITIIGFGFIFAVYFKNKDSKNLKFMFAGVQTLMYLCIMILGHAEVRFVFILPVLFYLVLYHSPGFIIAVSVLAIAVNTLNVVVCIFVFNMVSYDDYNRYVIQLIAIICSMIAASITAWHYRKAYRRNLEQAAQLEQMSLQTIETIANTIDAKDAYTQGHSRRVAEYSVHIAKRMGYSEEALSDLHYVALLHDVGKIAVPDSVLNKPTRLTNEEFNLMKTHTTAGADILKDIKSVPGIEQGARYHHERYDGRGYPAGLKGEEIPEIARIICLADAYDAMTSNRVYRKPLPYDIVISEIKACSGTQFDPKVAEAFLECLAEGEIMVHTHDDMVVDEDESIVDMSHDMYLDEEKLKDSLTGAYQEKYGLGVIEQRIAGGTGSLVLFNIVGLRRINYELGFIVGDYYVKMVADTIMRCRYTPFTVRFNGNQFLCYVDDIDREETTIFIKDCINRVAALEENDPLMEKSLDLTCAAVMMEDSFRTVNEHIESLEKILFLLKGKEGEYAFYDPNAEAQNSYDINKDMEILIQTIKNSETDSLSLAMGNKSMEDVISLIKDHPEEEMGVTLFTIKPIDEEHIVSVNLEYAMKLLEDGMKYTIKERGLISYYSALQRMVVLYGSYNRKDSWKEYFDEIEKDVLSFFHKNYDKIDVELGCSSAVIK